MTRGARWLPLLLTTVLVAITTSVPAASLQLKASLVAAEGGDPAGASWVTCEVHLINEQPAPRRGTIVIEGRGDPDRQVVSTHAAFAIEGESSITLPIVVLDVPTRFAALDVIARDESGLEQARTTVTSPASRGAVVLDMDPKRRLRPLLRDAELPISTSRGPRTIAIGSPARSSQSGLPLVPPQPAGYARVTLVVAPTSVLQGLPASALRTLGDWVLAGGALAVTVEDAGALGRSPLREWLGGEVRTGAARADLLEPREFDVVPETLREDGSEPPLSVERVAPSEPAAALLRSYDGGNLRAVPWGASASYGLGEVHLLAFHPGEEPFASDPWTTRSLVLLLRNALERRAQLALPHGHFREFGLDGIRRALDPNEQTRWTLLAAAGLLVLYAIVAGPLNFSRAARSGRPLFALPVLLGCAVITGAVIVALGIFTRGVFGRSNHLTLVEAGAGMPRAAATRFRSFYTPRARDLRVAATSNRAVLSPVAHREPVPHLAVGAHGLVLEGIRTRPWQTTLLRDDGFAELGLGVALLQDRRDGLVVINRAGRDLVSVVIHDPVDTSLHFHPVVRDGQRVVARQGRRIKPDVRRSPTPLGVRAADLGVSAFAAAIDGDSPGSSAAWQALQSYSLATDWWPVDVPALIGQLRGGEGVIDDSGLPLESDMVLVRVIGYGGHGE